MERLRALWLCSITVLLGTALLLPAPGSTQALSNAGRKDLAMEEDLAKEIILGVRAVEPPEEAEISQDVEQGSKVVSSSTWARWVAHQAQAGPEQDHDHLHHSQDDAAEADAQGPPLMLSLQVQNGPEEDHDHLYHS
ncbi:PREDICTED: proline-rich acidic protein 1 [Nestor notabilis]|uniref:proline-rich acidic protein 1 n=1 Tax=Nestor notabilis TaxID=176057 RepID=UPI000523CFCA|nr:PREDICTED: proline-rich acidic protein 1 [Nestor notabilis]